MEEGKSIQIKGLAFVPYIKADRIGRKVELMAQLLSSRYAGRSPLVIVLMNGAFVFAADLLRKVDFAPEIMFVAAHSYKGMESTGELRLEYGWDAERVAGRDIIIVEDIVDSGRTLEAFRRHLEAAHAKSVAIATLLLKPDALRNPLALDYVGFRIPNAFVLGYGMDYDGHGRSLPDIYQLLESAGR